MNTQIEARIAALTASLPQIAKCGTRTGYRAGCRCLKCRAANTRYATESESRRRSGDTRELVPSKRAATHVRTLGRQGMGYRQVAESAKVAISLVASILAGRRTQIRANTERRILAVQYEIEALGDGTRVPAGPTWRLLNELLERGYTKMQLAVWLGSTSKTPSLQIRRDMVTVATVARVRRLYDDINAGRKRRD